MSYSRHSNFVYIFKSCSNWFRPVTTSHKCLAVQTSCNQSEPLQELIGTGFDSSHLDSLPSLLAHVSPFLTISGTVSSLYSIDSIPCSHTPFHLLLFISYDSFTSLFLFLTVWFKVLPQLEKDCNSTEPLAVATQLPVSPHHQLQLLASWNFGQLQKTGCNWLQLQSTDFNWLLVLVFKIIVIYCRQRLRQRNGIRKMMFSCQLRHWIVTKITTRVNCMSNSY